MKKTIRWKMIGIDICIALLILIGFAYVQYLRPQVGQKADIVNAAESDEQSSDDKNVAEADEQVTTENHTDINENTSITLLNPTHSSLIAFQTLNPDAEITQADQYVSSDNQVQTYTYQIKQTRNEQLQTIYVTDIYVTDVTKIKAAFGQDTYGRNLREKPMDILRQHEGVIGISGDNYGEDPDGIVIRNGKWYRTEQDFNDVCVLYKDGTMETYAPQDFDEATVRAGNPWQAWSFGPALLTDTGDIKDTFNTSDYIAQRNPRCAFGYVESGHYLMIVIDGRENGYAVGLSMAEFSEFVKELGCKQAYNLDGGKTATMMRSDMLINKPCEGIDQEGGLDMTDIIYVSK